MQMNVLLEYLNPVTVLLKYRVYIDRIFFVKYFQNASIMLE